MAKRIMVINNSDDILAAFHKILAREDHQVFLHIYTDADLSVVKQIRPDVIILDLFVGREGLGWQFLQLLRMDDETTSIPVLLCTTTVKLVHEIADYLVSIRVTVLRKPFTSKELERSVQKVLTTHGDHTSSGPADHNGNTSV